MPSPFAASSIAFTPLGGSETVLLFKIMKGQPIGLAHRVIVYDRSGVDGSAARIEGKTASPKMLLTRTDFTNAAAAKAQTDLYLAAVGQVVTITNSFGVEHVNAGVLDMQENTVAAKTIVGGLNVTDGDDGVVVDARWQIQIFSEGGA